MEKRRLTLSQAAQQAGVSVEEIRCAIASGVLLGVVSENTGMFTIDAAALEAYVKAHAHGPADGDRKRVLIVDDEINFGNLLKLDLQRDKRIVAKFATWGRDGIRLAQEFQPHLILLDFMLPDTTGEGVLRELHDLQATNGTKVIVYSAHAETVVRDDPKLSERLKALGADGFITKTIGLKKLVAEVKRALGLEATAA